MKAFYISERLLLYLFVCSTAIQVVLKRLIRFVRRQAGEKLVDLLHKMTGLRPLAIDLPAKIALNRHDRRRRFRRKSKNFFRTTVNKLCSQLHWELCCVLRVDAAAETVARFQQGDALPSFREMAGGSQPGNAAADDQGIHNCAAVTSCLEAPETGIGYTPNALAAPISTVRTSFCGVFLSQAWARAIAATNVPRGNTVRSR